MSRRAHPQAVVRRAKELRGQRLSYGRIAFQLEKDFGVKVGESTVRDWVTYRTRGA